MSQFVGTNDPGPFMTKIHETAEDIIRSMQSGLYVTGHIIIRRREVHSEPTPGVEETQHLVTIIEIHLLTQAGFEQMVREQEQDD